MNKLQTFTNADGNIICIKCGWIAADIPAEWNITKAEIRGTSTRFLNSETPISYFDIALNGRVSLHIFRTTLDGLHYGAIRPYFFEEYPC